MKQTHPTFRSCGGKMQVYDNQQRKWLAYESYLPVPKAAPMTFVEALAILLVIWAAVAVVMQVLIYLKNTWLG